MKHIKQYNQLTEKNMIEDHMIEDELTNILHSNKEPQIGDYIIYNDNSIFTHKPMKQFMLNNIGQIISDQSLAYDFVARYQNIPKELKHDFSFKMHDFNFKMKNYGDNCRGVNIENIEAFSPNKEELEQELLNKKYNL